MKQYLVALNVQVSLPTSAVDSAGAATLAQHAAELAFANLPQEFLSVEVIHVGEYDPGD